jgi:AraC family transcriptional regulator
MAQACGKNRFSNMRGRCSACRAERHWCVRSFTHVVLASRRLSMKFQIARAWSGSHVRMDARESALARGDCLTVALCERGSVVSTEPGLHSLWCPVFGTMSVAAGDWRTRLARGDLCVADSLTRHTATVSDHGVGVAIIGTAAAWSGIGRTQRTTRRGDAVLFPAVHRRQAALCRRVLRFARHCLDDVAGAHAAHLEQRLALLVDDLQAPFADMIARCPGSSLMRKKAVFLRLQRVRSHIDACAHQDLDVAALALMANYSVSHFITTFRSVFGETPYSALSRYRLENAGTLLSGSELAIGDVAQSTGFQSRSSFSRAIKRHFGRSASGVRARLRQPLVP